MASLDTQTTAQPKPIIILIHGGASSSRMYNTVLPLLEPTYTVVTPNLPGHGATARQTGPFTFEAATETIAECVISATATDSSGSRPKILIVGISLGGQAVLSFLLNRPAHIHIDAALVSGVSIHPPSGKVTWEMPHMPSDQTTIDMMMEDVALAGMENMPALQARSLGFTFDPVVEGPRDTTNTRPEFPPTLVMIGEHDMAMQRRDFEELVEICKRISVGSEGIVLKGAWHNHSIDVPEDFAQAVLEWAGRVL